jgi:bifunctional non-homologous end joining protein LigD
MVHKHNATRLHYDIRLELDGVLLSFAVPKGPSADPKQRHLAVHVEDHPLEYAGFEGVIPHGQYGGGPSLIWDAGTFSPDEGGRTYWDDRDAAQAELRTELAAGKLGITFRGKKLKGSYAFIHTKPATNEWLLLKHRDAAAQSDRDILDDGRSVASRMTTEELRSHPELSGTNYPGLGSLADVPGATIAPMRFVEPMLAMAAPISSRADGWSFEPKLDGIRALVAIDHGKATIRSRSGRDITALYPGLAHELAGQPVATCLLDGEIVAVSATGRPSFELLQQRMNLQDPGLIASAEANIPVVYYTFDVLYLDGFDLTDAALSDRREMLVRLLLPSSRVAEVITIDASPEDAFNASIAAGFEGIIAKRNNSKYEAGRRSGAWLKRKGLSRDVFVVGGYLRGTGSRSTTFGGLLIGQPMADGTLKFCGRVGGGFTERDIDRVLQELQRLKSDNSPFSAKTPDDRVAAWVRPELEIEVEYTEITSAGSLRAPVFKGLASDRTRGPVVNVVEAGMNVASQALKADELSAQLESSKQKLTLEGDGWDLAVSNLDKELWPATETGRAVTKRDLLKYAIAASRYVLPHLKDRPLTLLRFPNGITGKKFYQRHWEQELPAFVESVSMFTEGQDKRWLLCNNLPTLLWLCQLADIEWHASLARAVAGPDAPNLSTKFTGSVENLEDSALNYPDFVLFDLDPYIFAGHERPGAEPEPSRQGFAKTSEVAHALKELLDSLGLMSFVKTSGATGIHVYVPIVRNLDYGSARAAATTIFGELARRRPKDTTIEWVSGKRTNKVFLDANQNARQKCLAGPFSPRAKPGAPASLPQRWSDLGKVYPGDLSIVDPWWLQQPDAWAQILASRNDLKRLLGL